jgi:hypothetical protein
MSLGVSSNNLSLILSDFGEPGKGGLRYEFREKRMVRLRELW